MIHVSHKQEGNNFSDMSFQSTGDPVLAAVIADDVLARLSEEFSALHAALLVRGKPRFSSKFDGSNVSDFELEIEHKLCSWLSEICPECSVEGEEGFRYNPEGGSPYKWSVDPIDGSISFQNDLPFYSFVATLVKDDEEPLACVIVTPKLARTVTATQGGGTWVNGNRVDISTQEFHGKSVLAVSDDYTFDILERAQYLERIRELPNPVRSYTDAYAHTLVAEGVCALKFDAACAEWDRFPAELIVREAGGEVLFIPAAEPDPDLCGSLLLGQPAAFKELKRALGL